jgi:hypothetical protein
MGRTGERGSPHRHAGRWVVLDARFLRLLSIDATTFAGTSPKAVLDPIARRILLPRMRAASRDRRPVADVADDHGRRWNVRVEPLVGAKSGQLLALRGCYWRSESTMPAPPPVGGWELRVTPPGPHQSMRVYWSPGLFTVHDLAVPAGDSPHGMEGPQWLDETVMEADRAETRLFLEGLAAATSDALHFHTFRIRGRRTGREHRIRSAIWRDTSEAGPDIWLRGVSIRSTDPESSTDSGRVSTRFLEALLALGPDPVFAIDTVYEQLFLTTARFAQLGVALPADRHLLRICHRDDVAALRTMLAEATTNTGTVAGPVRVRLAGQDGWTTVDLLGAAVRNPGTTPRHVLCLVQRPGRVLAEHAA